MDDGVPGLALALPLRSPSHFALTDHRLELCEVRKHWETHSLDYTKWSMGCVEPVPHLKFLKGELYIAISLSRFKLIRSDRTVCGESSFAQCRVSRIRERRS
jgi:hypothetical protein